MRDRRCRGLFQLAGRRANVELGDGPKLANGIRKPRQVTITILRPRLSVGDQKGANPQLAALILRHLKAIQ